MLKDYPATQLFLISLMVLTFLVLITPVVKEYHYFAAVLDSLKFIVKVFCGFLLYFTVIDIMDGMNVRKHKHPH